MATEYVSQWKEGWKEERLTQQSFLDMLQGKIPYIREPGFLDRDLAQKLEDLMVPQLSPYLHATGPALLKVGLAQFEFQALSEDDVRNRTDDAKERYFSEVEKNKDLHKEIAEKVGQNVWQLIVDKLKSTVPTWDVDIATEGPGKDYFSGIFRVINNSTPIHCDWSPYDSRTEDWIIKEIAQQAVFNLYLAPFKGGRTEVHDVQWTPDVLKYRDPASYGYEDAIVEGRNKATLQPQVGDLYLFNTRNMHQVFPVEPEEEITPDGLVQKKRDRLTFSSFLGVLPANEANEKNRLILWS